MYTRLNQQMSNTLWERTGGWIIWVWTLRIGQRKNSICLQNPNEQYARRGNLKWLYIAFELCSTRPWLYNIVNDSYQCADDEVISHSSFLPSAQIADGIALDLVPFVKFTLVLCVAACRCEAVQ